MQKELRNISREELSNHNGSSSSSSKDLWICIDGKVYDVTSWMQRHPGGDLALRSFAGQDASDAFLAFHPPRARGMLPKFLIGQVQDYQPLAVTQDHKRVVDLLRRAGLLDIPVGFYAKMAAVMLLLLAGVVAGVVLCSSPWVHMLCALVLGVVWIEAGFIGHDAGHTGILGGRTDDVIGLLVGNCLTGISFSWWRRNHNAHHFSCNSLDHDPDVQYVPLFAVSPGLFASLYSKFYDRVMTFDWLARLLVSYQHWTFYLVMALARINLYAQSLLLLLLHPKLSSTRRWLELCCLGVFFSWMALLVSYLPTPGERVAFVLLSLATTGVQHVQFCLNHFSSPVYTGPPKGDQWFQAQSRGTLNLSCDSAIGIGDIFHGGLHYQIEHHFFPKVPRPNLRAASAIIKPLLVDKHGLPYVRVSFWRANLMLLSTLRSAALEARKLGRHGPVPKSLVWEAVNAIG